MKTSEAPVRNAYSARGRIPRVSGVELELATMGTLRRQNGINIPVEIFHDMGERFRFCEMIKNKFLSPWFHPGATIPNIGHRWFFEDGSAMYFDTGQHLELNTAECSNGLELLECEKSAEARCTAFIKAFSEDPSFLDNDIKLRLGKNNVDSKNETYGTHENYLLNTPYKTRGAPEDKSKIRYKEHIRSVIGPHILPQLASRIIYSGNGHVICPQNDMPRYALSQRAGHMSVGIGEHTTNARGMISLGKIPHANPYRLSRLHIICGDANMLEVPIFLKCETMLILLDMIESGYLSTPVLSVPPHEAHLMLQKFSSDPTLQATYEIEGKSYTAVAIQELHRDRARAYYASECDKDAVRESALDLWDECIARAKMPRPHEALKKYADWALKLVQIEKLMDKRGVSFATPGSAIIRTYNDSAQEMFKKQPLTLANLLLACDFHYSYLMPEGFAFQAIKEGLTHRVTTDARIASAGKMPPGYNRAFGRSSRYHQAEAAARNAERVLYYFTTWTDEIIQLKNHPNNHFILRIKTRSPISPHPLNISNRLERLLNS